MCFCFRNIKLNFDKYSQTEPQVSEEWIDEDKLELWEIKLYGEKQEKLTAAQVLPITRTSTGKLPPTRNITSSSGDLSNSSTPTSNGNSASGSSLANKSAIISSKASREEINEQMEQQLRLQRAAHNQKRAMELKQQQDGANPPKQSIVQRCIIVKEPDGTTKIIQQNITQSSRSASASTSQPNQRQQSPAPAKPDGPQKVQIIRDGKDGKVSDRGLNPGQQLIQTPDGKLHVLSAASGSNSTASKQEIATKAGQNIITKVATSGGSTTGATAFLSASPVTTTFYGSVTAATNVGTTDSCINGYSDGYHPADCKQTIQYRRQEPSWTAD
ncbi:nucleosome-remodeling factor subunit NURF301-like isoform X2 [Toxorhynchites rutilus septentrionalis]|uniref:nucleosome-remodeling factor subunit NURF301-like isoform X2 n=1 Tax=Toxorhynchites rutilus septentrionalis TaxID=329112 RepID=UPI00247ABE4C|nr:nucleosome-remodeling factor subunit NURF301-like isoform X2 [Toxorhynchites rutilus septentrionalis]XP_055628906.1 nucleosome-remodeling factor subunit NURF301-like isoform X2 [Toxorhynchites rutilus septentrionalis]XP_055628907.1 nucleosome-remodeling factor subunit NURF301-like isoform X2 [Toxorhynchites rutilus septentrionalis]XP_055628908.1 nucleosome-remodeling factor subunit NURF301-like isoform X2 [Toxorhynchites rutilus septentrionalis]